MITRESNGNRGTDVLKGQGRWKEGWGHATVLPWVKVVRNKLININTEKNVDTKKLNKYNKKYAGI